MTTCLLQDGSIKQENREDHPNAPADDQMTRILGRQSGMLMELLLKSKVVCEKLKATGYDLEEV